MLSGAAEICVTDHPSSPALTSGTIQTNIQESLELLKSGDVRPVFSINGHEWGSTADSFACDKSYHYTKIIVADCLWMRSQHRNLACSIAHFLAKECPQACALVIAGFHTGRQILADFFRQFQPTSENDGDREDLVIAEIYESDMCGTRRPWCDQRANEVKQDVKKWCVIAVIVRASQIAARNQVP